MDTWAFLRGTDRRRVSVVSGIPAHLRAASRRPEVATLLAVESPRAHGSSVMTAYGSMKAAGAIIISIPSTMVGRMRTMIVITGATHARHMMGDTIPVEAKFARASETFAMLVTSSDRIVSNWKRVAKS
jgi:hypothetical protein